MCFAAGRLQHAARPVHQQEFLNGRLDRSREALEGIVEQRAQVNGDKGFGVCHAYRIAPACYMGVKGRLALQSIQLLLRGADAIRSRPTPAATLNETFSS